MTETGLGEKGEPQGSAGGRNNRQDEAESEPRALEQWGVRHSRTKFGTADKKVLRPFESRA